MVLPCPGSAGASGRLHSARDERRLSPLRTSTGPEAQDAPDFPESRTAEPAGKPALPLPAPGALLTPRGHSMSPKMFLMQATRYSCRPSVMPSKSLQARMTTSRAWLSSHSEISVSVSCAGEAAAGTQRTERGRGAGGHSRGSRGLLRTELTGRRGWVPQERGRTADSRATSPLLRGQKHTRVHVCDCMSVCSLGGHRGVTSARARGPPRPANGPWNVVP